MAGIDRFFEDCETEDFVNSLYEAVWSNVSASIDLKMISQLEIPMSRDIAMHKLSTILGIATLQHDAVYVPGECIETFIAEEEPKAPPIDIWARGSVPLRHYVAPEEAILRGEVEEGTSVPSVTSASQRTGSRARSRAGSEKSRMTKRDGTPLKFDDQESQVVFDLEDVSDRPPEGSTGHMFDMLMKAVSDKRHYH